MSYFLLLFKKFEQLLKLLTTRFLCIKNTIQLVVFVMIIEIFKLIWACLSVWWVHSCRNMSWPFQKCDWLCVFGVWTQKPLSLICACSIQQQQRVSQQLTFTVVVKSYRALAPDKFLDVKLCISLTFVTSWITSCTAPLVLLSLPSLVFVLLVYPLSLLLTAATLKLILPSVLIVFCFSFSPFIIFPSTYFSPFYL